ncbi:peptidyl-prolyl cis-trans isomerase C [Novimethylophilus kurashikiensis]|uniref:peptidylprolyl isomerase n=1 Tax=Novimethylophilus kurashikiensis TaxID=1825523 RepID=A0A2R5F7M1_9PROT|nr:peptidylprolyl isomerase [Novimethylophilus kurashikiensis]GBG12634.1 peptidyl-prolyl cis-trans isomerase C [Novimethylophilus kurashikiensis]
MRVISKLLGVLLLAAAVSAQAADPATVNGKPIKQSLVDYIVKDATARGQKVDDNIRAVIINKLISSELIAQEAQKSGFDKQPDYQAKEELMRRELLVNSYLQDYVKKNPISDATLKSEYDKFKAQMGDKEFKASHILVKTEQEAKDIIAQLGKGGDFAKIAREKSLDPGSKDKGGDLGWFPPAAMVKPFSDAVSSLQKGKYTAAPVQTQFGWHVIKLEDTRDAQPPAFDKVKDELRNNLQKQQLEKLVNDLRAKAKIVDNTSKK